MLVAARAKRQAPHGTRAVLVHACRSYVGAASAATSEGAIAPTSVTAGMEASSTTRVAGGADLCRRLQLRHSDVASKAWEASDAALSAGRRSGVDPVAGCRRRPGVRCASPKKRPGRAVESKGREPLHRRHPAGGEFMRPCRGCGLPLCANDWQGVRVALKPVSWRFSASARSQQAASMLAGNALHAMCPALALGRRSGLAARAAACGLAHSAR